MLSYYSKFNKIILHSEFVYLFRIAALFAFLAMYFARHIIILVRHYLC